MLTHDAQANLGLRVGGKISGGSPLVDAQIVGYVNNTLRFHAQATGTVSSTQGNTATYSYGVYLLYNIGYGAYATIKFFPNWALKPRNAFNPSKQFTIYENSGSFLGTTKRSIEAPPKLPRRGLSEDWPGMELSAVDQVHSTHGHSHGHHHSHAHLHHSEADLSRNTSSAMSVQSLLGKRADDNSPTVGQGLNTAPLTCPPGATAQVRVPDYRRKLYSFNHTLRTILIHTPSQLRSLCKRSAQRKRSDCHRPRYLPRCPRILPWCWPGKQWYNPHMGQRCP